MEAVPIGIMEKRPFLLFVPFLLSKMQKNGKTAVFSIIPIGTASIVSVGHFFTDLDGPNKFCWSQTKIRGTLPRWAPPPTQP